MAIINYERIIIIHHQINIEKIQKNNFKKSYLKVLGDPIKAPVEVDGQFSTTILGSRPIRTRSCPGSRALASRGTRIFTG